jgi:hypothetical protein
MRSGFGCLLGMRRGPRLVRWVCRRVGCTADVLIRSVSDVARHHKSPWQRGSNENTNGLVRQYLPRTLDFRTLTQTDFDAIADQLNERPRQTLGFKTPSQALAEVLR